MRALRILAVVAGIAASVAVIWWCVEMALLKASRYRLSHGDGREHTFRRRS